jgi:hypothetical protein
VSSYEGINRTPSELHEREREHPWAIHLDILVGMPCCNGPTFRPSTLVWTHDLSEANEDRFVKAAEETVRQAFDFARRYGRISRLLKDAGGNGHGPLSGVER